MLRCARPLLFESPRMARRRYPRLAGLAQYRRVRLAGCARAPGPAGEAGCQLDCTSAPGLSSAVVCLCALCTDRFLRAVHGTDVFLAYCRDRDLLIPISPSDLAAGHWAAALSALPDDRRGRIASELAAVYELGAREGIAHLLEADGGAGPAPDTIPDGIPLALWFLLHRADYFWEVFFHHEPREADPRYVGRAVPGLSVPDLQERTKPLAAALGAFFRERDGTPGPAAGRGAREELPRPPVARPV
jgi:hypothetical protein